MTYDAYDGNALAVCALDHGGEWNPATVYGHYGSPRTCIRLRETGQWVYDPAWETGAPPPPDRISVPRPRITTGPAHMSVDEATGMYLRNAAMRVRDARYWGSGVTALVSDLLDNAADAVDPQTDV